MKWSKGPAALVRLLRLSWSQQGLSRLGQDRQSWGSTLSWVQEAWASSKQTRGVYLCPGNHYLYRTRRKGQITAGVFGLDRCHGFLIGQEHTSKGTEGLRPLKCMGLQCEGHRRPLCPASCPEAVLYHCDITLSCTKATLNTMHGTEL